MNFENNMNYMLGGDNKAEKEKNLMIAEQINELQTLKQIATFFKSPAGKQFLSWMDIVKEELRDQLEVVDNSKLITVQANIKAIKMFLLLLEDKIDDISTYEDLLDNFLK